MRLRKSRASGIRPPIELRSTVPEQRVLDHDQCEFF